MTPPVLLSVANYCSICKSSRPQANTGLKNFLAFTDVCLFSLFPLFYSTPIELGGLGFDPFKIAISLAGYGIMNGLVQVLFFAKMVDRFGAKSIIITSTVIYPFVLALFPVMNFVSRSEGISPLVWVLVGFQLLLTVGFGMSFGA
jgi:MFS family permease